MLISCMNKLTLDTVVIGGNLQSLIYSFSNSLPIVLVNPQIPPASQLTGCGLSKKLLWERLSFILSFAGLNPCAQKISSYRIEEDNTIKLFGKTPYTYSVSYNNLINYDTATGEEQYAVIDNFKILNLSYKLMYVFNELNTGDEFINNIRISAARNNMRGAATSYLALEKAKSDNFSETYARLKIENLLKDNGMTGKYIGTIKEPVFKPVKVELLNREIYPLNSAENDLINKKPLPSDPYLLKCLQIFGNPYDP